MSERDMRKGLEIDELRAIFEILLKEDKTAGEIREKLGIKAGVLGPVKFTGASRFDCI